ncbi:hypothetical protein L6452_36177 [Arctium lappa]|uniref:Uncharacterized protein n=1 Tax=Arctium lappa TaxID=4217 RepID=A0ACB8YCN9_ARCLA|nr:hypothetical protein L6452_36177 [Arctium lappa]
MFVVLISGFGFTSKMQRKDHPKIQVKCQNHLGYISTMKLRGNYSSMNLQWHSHRFVWAAEASRISIRSFTVIVCERR